MGFDGRQVANFVLDYADGQGWGVTNLALQKLVYFCHAWMLVKTGVPLVRHEFEAWEYGPVLQYLYREFKPFGSSRITSRCRGLNRNSGQIEVVAYDFDAATIEILETVLSFYGRMSPSKLVDLSHAEGGPWHSVWNHDGIVNPGMRIENERIRDYYSRLPRRQSAN